MTPIKPDELLNRMMDWLRSQGIELDETIIRHVIGIRNSLETRQGRKH